MGNDPVNMVDPTGLDGVSAGISLKIFGEGLTNTISIRYPGATNEPFDIQLQTSLSSGTISSFALDQISPGNALSEMNNGFNFGKLTLNLGWDFSGNEGSGFDISADGHVGAGLFGGTIGEQNMLTDGTGELTSYELNIGPQLGASTEGNMEFTASGRDLINAGRDLFNSVTGGGNNSDKGMSSGNVRICSGMGAEKGGCQ